MTAEENWGELHDNYTKGELAKTVVVHGKTILAYGQEIKELRAALEAIASHPIGGGSDSWSMAEIAEQALKK